VVTETDRNTRHLPTEIPVTIIISDKNVGQVYSALIFMKAGEEHTVQHTIPAEKDIQSLQVVCYWTDHPQQKAETIITVTKRPFYKRVLSWLGK